MLGAVIVLVLISAAVQLWNVHRMTSDWTLWPKEVPSKVQFANRDYQCGPNPVPDTRSLEGLAERGKTAGGADIYTAEPGTLGGAVTWVVVKTEAGAYACDLLGGP
jgi:hypothetical protein